MGNGNHNGDDGDDDCRLLAIFPTHVFFSFDLFFT